jgi:hypothetical protein
MNRHERRAASAQQPRTERAQFPKARWTQPSMEGATALEHMGLGQVSAAGFLTMVGHVRREGTAATTVVVVLKFDGGAFVRVTTMDEVVEVVGDDTPAESVVHATREAIHRAELVGGVGIVFLDMRRTDGPRPLVAIPAEQRPMSRGGDA